MRSHEPPRRGWRFAAGFVLIVFLSMLLLQQTVARALAGWLAGLWVTTLDMLMRILGAPLGA